MRKNIMTYVGPIRDLPRLTEEKTVEIQWPILSDTDKLMRVANQRQLDILESLDDKEKFDSLVADDITIGVGDDQIKIPINADSMEELINFLSRLQKLTD